MKRITRFTDAERLWIELGEYVQNMILRNWKQQYQMKRITRFTDAERLWIELGEYVQNMILRNWNRRYLIYE